MKSEYDDDLRKDAPNLFGKDKRNPFEVPDGFFENFSSNIQDKIAAQQKQSVWSIVYHNLIKPKFAIPVLASVCIIAVGIKLLNKTAIINTNNNIAVTYNDLSQSDYFADINVSDLSEALNNTTSSISNNVKTESDSYRLDKNQIENYLIENNVDVSDLANELN